jgi:hypothetical protein
MGMIDVHQLRLFGIDGTHNAASTLWRRTSSRAQRSV